MAKDIKKIVLAYSGGLDTSIILKYSEGPDFNPYANSGWMSLAMLEELAATAQVVGRG